LRRIRCCPSCIPRPPLGGADDGHAIICTRRATQSLSRARFLAVALPAPAHGGGQLAPCGFGHTSDASEAARWNYRRVERALSTRRLFRCLALDGELTKRTLRQRGVHELTRRGSRNLSASQCLPRAATRAPVSGAPSRVGHDLPVLELRFSFGSLPSPSLASLLLHGHSRPFNLFAGILATYCPLLGL
jgi:hypothetical protein